MQHKDLYKIIEPHSSFGLRYFTFLFHQLPSTKYLRHKIETERLKTVLAAYYPEQSLNFVQNGQFENNEDIISNYENIKLLVVLKDGLVLEQSKDSITFYYDNRISIEELVGIKTAIENASPKDLDDSKFFMIQKCQYEGFDLIPFKSKRKDIRLTDYYNDDLVALHENIVSFLNKPDLDGVVLFHGQPGTGKTSYIRQLISSVKSRFIFIPNNLFVHISDPEFITFISSFPGSIIILEDCEELLRSCMQQSTDVGLSNILNLGDGLLGDALKLKIICTFNCELSRIDDAILRKGRLAYRYEFGPLNAEKANALFTTLGKNTTTDQPLSLAELFNFDHENQASEFSRKSIGF